jgi:hypothetical protein
MRIMPGNGKNVIRDASVPPVPHRLVLLAEAQRKSENPFATGKGIAPKLLHN